MGALFSDHAVQRVKQGFQPSGGDLAFSFGFHMVISPDVFLTFASDLVSHEFPLNSSRFASGSFMFGFGAVSFTDACSDK